MCSCTDISSLCISTGISKMATPQKATKGLVLLRSCLLLVAILAWTWSSAIAFQPEDTSVSEPALSEDDSSDAGHSTDTEELDAGHSTDTEESDDGHSSSSTTLMPEEFETMGRISKTIKRFRYEPLTCCHRAREYPFADKLRDHPCSVKKETMGEEDAADFIAETEQVNDHLVESLEKLQNMVKVTLREDVPVLCKDIRWYPLAKIPEERDIKVLGHKGSLYLYHSSLLNHTAYLHHMFYQVHKYDRSCNRGEIVVSARRLILVLKKVTCNLRRYLLAVYDKDINEESFEKPLEESLDVSLCEECVCAGRALYDCHVVLSLNYVLNQFANFMDKISPALVLFGSALNLPLAESFGGHSLIKSRESATLSTEESTTPLSESMDMKTQPDVTAIESTETTEESKRRRIPCPPAKNFMFAYKLRQDPCNILPSDGVTKKAITGVEPDAVTVYNILKQYVDLLKRTTDNTKRNDLLKDCVEYKYFSVARMLKKSDLITHDAGKILFLYYSSLTNLTAHVYNMHNLLQKYDTTCSKGIISASARTLAFDIRKVTCFLRLYILQTYPAYNEDSFIKPIMQVMEEPLCDEYYCTRRAIYDCLVVTTLDDVLGEMATFMERIDPKEATQKLQPNVLIKFRRFLNYP